MNLPIPPVEDRITVNILLIFLNLFGLGDIKIASSIVTIGWALYYILVIWHLLPL